MSTIEQVVKIESIKVDEFKTIVTLSVDFRFEDFTGKLAKFIKDYNRTITEQMEDFDLTVAPMSFSRRFLLPVDEPEPPICRDCNNDDCPLDQVPLGQCSELEQFLKEYDEGWARLEHNADRGLDERFEREI